MLQYDDLLQFTLPVDGKSRSPRKKCRVSNLLLHKNPVHVCHYNEYNIRINPLIHQFSKISERRIRNTTCIASSFAHQTNQFNVTVVLKGKQQIWEKKRVLIGLTDKTKFEEMCALYSRDQNHLNVVLILYNNLYNYYTWIYFYSYMFIFHRITSSSSPVGILLTICNTLIDLECLTWL